MSRKTENRVTILQAVTTPLGFFALALLIVEAFLASVVIGGELTDQQRTMALYSGVGLFLLLIIIVAALVWRKKADDLTFDKKAHLDRAADQSRGGTYSLTRDPSGTVSVKIDPGNADPLQIARFRAAIGELNDLLGKPALHVITAGRESSEKDPLDEYEKTLHKNKYPEDKPDITDKENEVNS